MKIDFTKKIYLQYFFPTIMVSIGLAFSNIIDSLVVGQRIGEEGLAAISLSSPVYMIFASLYMCTSLGGSIEVSKEIGNGNIEKASQLFNQIMEFSTLLSILLMVVGVIFTPEIAVLLGATPVHSLTYQLTCQYIRITFLSTPCFFITFSLYYLIRIDNSQNFASIAYFIGTLTDVIFNIVFVLGLNWGIVGSALATLLGQIIAICILLFYFTQKDRVFFFHLQKIDWKRIRTCLKIGFSNSNQYISQFVFILLSNYSLLRLFGSSAIAVFDVILNTSYVVLIFFNAAADSIAPIASTLYGERNYTEAKNVFKLSLFTGMGLGSILLLITAILAKSVCHLFGIDHESTIQLGCHAIHIYCMGAWFSGFSIIFSSYYQATDRENATFLISLLRGAILLIGYTVLFSFTDIYFFWFLFPATEATTLIIAYPFTKKKWANSFTQIPKESFMTATLDASLSQLSNVMTKAEEMCMKYHATGKQHHYVLSAIEEMSLSIQEHYQAQKRKDQLCILITMSIEESGDIRLCIRDNGTARNPFDIEHGKISKNDLDDMDVLNGLGIKIVKAKAKSFYYRRFQNYNSMIIDL